MHFLLKLIAPLCLIAAMGAAQADTRYDIESPETPGEHILSLTLPDNVGWRRMMSSGTEDLARFLSEDYPFLNIEVRSLPLKKRLDTEKLPNPVPGNAIHHSIVMEQLHAYYADQYKNVSPLQKITLNDRKALRLHAKGSSITPMRTIHSTLDVLVFLHGQRLIVCEFLDEAVLVNGRLMRPSPQNAYQSILRSIELH